MSDLDIHGIYVVNSIVKFEKKKFYEHEHFFSLKNKF